jgi:hypothetical protein
MDVLQYEEKYEKFLQNCKEIGQSVVLGYAPSINFLLRN